MFVPGGGMTESCYNCALRHLCYLYSAMIDEAFNEDTTVPHKLWCNSYTKEEK